MSDFLKKHSREIILLTVVLISVVLIWSSIVLMSRYTSELEEQARVKSLLYVTDSSAYLRDAVNNYKREASILAETVSIQEPTSNENFAQIFRSAGKADRYSSLLFARYFNDGIEYAIDGSVFDQTAENPVVIELSKRDEVGFAGIYADQTMRSNVIVFTAPIKDNQYCDAIVLFYAPEVVMHFTEQLNEDYLSRSDFSVVATHEGETLKILSNESKADIYDHANIYDILKGLINDKSLMDTIKNDAVSGVSEAFIVEVDGVAHVVSVGGVGEKNAALAIISLYECSKIYDSGYNIISTVLGAVVLFFMVMIVFVIYFIISARRNDKRFQTVNDFNDRLDCPSRTKFEREANAIINRNSGSNFAVVVIELKHYNYLASQYDSDTVDKVLGYLKMLYSESLQLDETYGYMDDSRFILLLHYRDEDSLVLRLKSYIGAASVYRGKLPAGFKIELMGGIYEEKRKATDDVSKMVDFAIEAKNAGSISADFGSFRFYDERLQENREQSEYIEMHMDTALENNNFVVFYQPKINLITDLPDGCEALVRWYNPELDEYMRPGVFMPLFEANGFIVKLDKYVYEQVCSYIEESTLQRQPLYPVSVNVSRATAIQDGFVDFYVSRKKKHNIIDGFLTIEFTESFAYENYDKMREIINQLHRNGFKCSIDDFGTGFSSYNILKEIQMDEIKLDRFFIDKGISEERDRKILESVINLSKDLRMKVTQEGVETEEQRDMMRKLGCQVIQGYFYSKPLHLSDYIGFIEKYSHAGKR